MLHVYVVRTSFANANATEDRQDALDVSQRAIIGALLAQAIRGSFSPARAL
jgi:hypothetical protein